MQGWRAYDPYPTDGIIPDRKRWAVEVVCGKGRERL